MNQRLFASTKMKMVFTSLLMSVFFTTALAQTPDKAKLDQLFDRLNEKNKAMGSLVLSKDGNVIYSRMIGYSQVNGDDKKPLTAATRFRIGSISKMFTATMILQLIQEKKLGPDDKLAKFFPQIPNAEKITILHLLAHRSGIHDIADGQGNKTPRTHDEIIATIANGGSYFEPDSKYAYSNAGFIVLGYIVEKLTGKPYEKALQERITSKIGLNDTYLGTGLTDVAKNESYSYRFIGHWDQVPSSHLSIPGGAGGIISTPLDLTKFIRALFDGKLISQKSLDLMKQKDLGMERFTYNEKTFYGHGGGIDNFGSWLAYEPEEKLALAYTTNGKVYPVENIINGVLDIYANKPYTIPDFESTVISTEILDKYVGVYSMPDAPKFTVSREGNTLSLKMGDRPAYPLEAAGENKFKVPNSPLNVEFDVANKTMTLNRGGAGGKVFTKEN